MLSMFINAVLKTEILYNLKVIGLMLNTYVLSANTDLGFFFPFILKTLQEKISLLTQAHRFIKLRKKQNFGII